MNITTNILAIAVLLLTFVVVAEEVTSDEPDLQSGKSNVPGVWFNASWRKAFADGVFKDCLDLDSIGSEQGCEKLAKSTRKALEAALERSYTTVYSAGVVSSSMRITDYLGAQDYEVKEELLPMGGYKIHFTKTMKSAGRGLINVPWSQEIEGVATYYPTANQTLRLFEISVDSREKPPLFGSWESINTEEADRIKILFHTSFQTVQQ